jgi:tRNA threonylcarbamoyl adenosine modification protein (Sua5/YciO/YrdC/YwlC family)
MLVEVNPEHPEPRKIKRACDALQSGEVIAYPTDTVYGLGCDLFNKKAVDRLYQIKGPDLAEVSRYAVMHDSIYRILRRYLPGPYTFLLQATREVPKVVQSPRKTVGVKIPDHSVALALTRELGRPIISTTAARHGQDPHLDPREIDVEFAGLALVLDAGPGGLVPTSIIDLTGGRPQVVRAGAGNVSEFEE